MRFAGLFIQKSWTEARGSIPKIRTSGISDLPFSLGIILSYHSSHTYFRRISRDKEFDYMLSQNQCLLLLPDKSSL